MSKEVLVHLRKSRRIVAYLLLKRSNEEEKHGTLSLENSIVTTCFQSKMHCTVEIESDD